MRRERGGQLVGRAGRAVKQREGPRAHERARGCRPQAQILKQARAGGLQVPHLHTPSALRRT